MNETMNIGKFGKAKIPPKSDNVLTAIYTTTSWANDSRVTYIYMYAKKPASDDSVELPTSLFSVSSSA